MQLFLVNGFIRRVETTESSQEPESENDKFCWEYLEELAEQNRVNIESIRQRVMHIGTVEAEQRGIDSRVLLMLQKYIQSTNREKVRVVSVNLWP